MKYLRSLLSLAKEVAILAFVGMFAIPLLLTWHSRQAFRIMRFSIRDLLLVTVIVALGVGWWLDRSRLASELKKLTPAELQVSPDGTVTPPGGFRRLDWKVE